MRSLIVLALVAIAFAQGWMHPGFSATYYQEVKNTGLLALRGQEFVLNVTYEVIKVDNGMVTLKIYGNVSVVANGKKVSKPVNATVTVNPDWNNVSLPFLTPNKLKELEQKTKYTCKGTLCTFYVNVTQNIPNHGMKFVITGTEVIDRNLLILKEAKLNSVLYLIKNNQEKKIGTSQMYTKLVSVSGTGEEK